MISKELIDFVDNHYEWLKNKYKIDDKQKEILFRAVKLSEEVGELSQEILSHNSLQLKRKLDNYKKGNMEGEFADVIITTLLLAKSADVDVRKALENKIEKEKLNHKKSMMS
ncbi:MAG: MazG nucleotide pyrophosphohydrolase domain-containing protein [Candidatus Aenigmatarchaeota archaeon]